jgi:ariadne-1
MQRTIDDIADVLAIPSAAAQPLLRHHKWDKDRLFESYTNDADKEINSAGVYFRCTNQDYLQQKQKQKKIQQQICTKPKPNKPVTRSSSAASMGKSTITTTTTTTTTTTDNHYCAICFDDELQSHEMLIMPCGHEFCIECWKCQIKTKLEDGPSCILATCPQAKCNELVTEEEVASATPDLLEKYLSYQVRNFVEMNGKSRWCPGPGCDRIAAITSINGSLCDADSIIATCDKCTTCFCIKCGNEPHAPLLCTGLEKWKEKCKNESETANWILANTKPCPKCRARIEKNQGCNHMTCQHCKYEFCWICSGDWKDHGSNTGGYYNCNKFDNKDDSSDDQSDAAKAKRELDRYLHYYKRYHAHAEAQKFAMKQLKDTGNKMMLLQECKSNATWSDVEFLKTANEQLVDCRRVLKFTYVLAYYMSTPTKNNDNSTSATAALKSGSGNNVLKVKRKAGSSKDKNDASAKASAGKEDHVMISKEEQVKKMQKERFEYHQEMLEWFTECLSEMVEKSLKDINRTEVVNMVC